MKAMDRRPRSAWLRRAGWCITALAASSLQGGCALSSLMPQRTSLTGRFWNRGESPEPAPRYDLYAESVAAARADLPRAQSDQLAGRDGEAARADRRGTLSSADRLARVDQEGKAVAGKARGSARTDGTTIRVTLGRPESLPTLKDSRSGGTILASAATTNWRRPGQPAGQGRTSSQPHPGSPELAGPEPALPAPSESLTLENPSRPASAPDPRDSLETILSAARERLESMRTYQVRISRVERVGGQLQPEERLLLSIRRQPRAVRLEWDEGPSKGREVIYSAAINDRMMYVNMANSSIPLPRMTLPVDSPLVLKSSRHPITEAGFDTIFDKLFGFLAPSAGNTAANGRLVYKGIERPAGSDSGLHLLERVTPKGETWQVYLDATSYMPAIVSAYKTGTRELIERYAYKDLNSNPVELADAAAFDPDKRWGPSSGLLSRLARAASTPADPGARPSMTR